MKFIQQTPFFRLLLAVITGIIIYQFFIIPVWIIYIAVFLAFTLIFIPLILTSGVLQYRFRWLFGCGVFIVFIIFSYIICGNSEKKKEFDHLDKKGIFTVQILESPVEKERSYLCKIRLISFTDTLAITPAKGAAYLYVQKDSIITNILVGDILLIEAEFNSPLTIQNPDGFDYALYLKRQGISATAYITDSWVKIGHNESFSLLREADKCRNYLLSRYQEAGITGNEFAVLSALTLGYTDELDPDIRKSYSASGAMHILAVSGLHVGIVYMVLAFLLGFLNKGEKQRIIKTLLILLFLWCYAFITGLSPSVFRSTLMFSFVAIGNISKRKSHIYNTIFMSAFLMLIVNPDLLFNVGFQLSYSAVISIIYFEPKISGLLYLKNKPMKWLWNLLAVSFAAQLGTIPFTLFYFQSFPNYFLLTNMIAIPAATLIIYVAVILLITSFIPYITVLIAFILQSILKILNSSIIFIENLPFSVSSLSINKLQILLIFGVLCMLSYYLFHSKKYYFLAGGLCCTLLFFTINVYIKHDTNKSSRMIVYSGNKNTHINFLNGSSNFVYTTEFNELQKIASTYWNNRKLKKAELIDKLDWYSDGFISFQNQRILILQEDIGRQYTTASPLQLDYLIIGNGLKPRIKQLLECFKPKTIIIDKTITPWYSEQIKKECESNSIGFYSIREKGAYIAELPK